MEKVCARCRGKGRISVPGYYGWVAAPCPVCHEEGSLTSMGESFAGFDHRPGHGLNPVERRLETLKASMQAQQMAQADPGKQQASLGELLKNAQDLNDGLDNAIDSLTTLQAILHERLYGHDPKPEKVRNEEALPQPEYGLQDRLRIAHNQVQTIIGLIDKLGSKM